MSEVVNIKIVTYNERVHFDLLMVGARKVDGDALRTAAETSKGQTKTYKVVWGIESWHSSELLWELTVHEVSRLVVSGVLS